MRYFTLLSILLASCFSAQAEKRNEVMSGGIPLGRGMLWTEKGIGGAVSAGSSWGPEESTILTGFAGTAWFHYHSHILGGAFFDLGSARPGDRSQLFHVRYEGFSSYVGVHPSWAWQVGATLGLDQQQFYADTAEFLSPVLRTGQGFLTGQYGALGKRWKNGLGGWLAAGSRETYWRTSNNRDGWEWVLDVQPALSYSLHKHWANSDSLTLAYDLNVQFPMEWTLRKIDIAEVPGNSKTARAHMGLRVGIGVVF